MKPMRVGVVREIKAGENRVGLVPLDVEALRQAGHSVLLETQAGRGSRFSDAEYRVAGATLVTSSEEVYARAEMVVKVQEPAESEWPHLRPGQIVLAFFCFAAAPLFWACLESGAVCIAYEDEETQTGAVLTKNTLPLVLAVAAGKGSAAALCHDALRGCLRIADKKVAFAPLAEAFGLPHHPPETLLD